MRTAIQATTLAVLILAAQGASAAPGRPFLRNHAPGRGTWHPIAHAGDGAGLAPTTWGFVSHYSGALYGTGYYPFKVDYSYAGTNSMYGNTYNYPTYGFVNEIRAIYAFDVSALAGKPSPVWSAFMLDTRERPAAGNDASSGFAEINLVSNGNTHTLEGLALFFDNGATHLDVYDAEDFENSAPFDHPERAFDGNETLIGTIPVSTNVILPISLDVSAAVINDLGLSVIEIPTLNLAGLAALALLLASGGALLLRRRRA